jgi:hypothetical protein
MKVSDAQEYESNVIPQILLKNKKLIEIATDYIITKIREENPEKRIIFVFDAPRNSIYCKELQKSKVLWLMIW